MRVSSAWRALFFLLALQGFFLARTESVRAQSLAVSGVVNHYAAVSAIDPCRNQVVVSSTDGFAVGDRIMLIQMQEPAVDSLDSADFRFLQQRTAGLYELNEVGAIHGDTIVFGKVLLGTYDTSGRVQLVSMPHARVIDVTGNVFGIPWDGRVGGIVALDATDSLILHADIDVKGMGFRGGSSGGGSTQCSYGGNYVSAASGLGARKGEGIAISGNPLAQAGRGRFVNGGGGGNARGSGGGGGGNIRVGGSGGDQWSGCGSASAGGVGGGDLKYFTVLNRVYPGGGGGAGHGGTPGTNGGGLVFLQTNVLIDNDRRIDASGADQTATASKAGAGGGGSGGTVVFNIVTFVGKLTVNVMGANGGNVVSDQGDCFGPGGGGSGGIVIMLPVTSTSTGAVNVRANGGLPGRVLSPGSACDQTANGATGGDLGGVFRQLQVLEGSVPFAQPSVSLTLPTFEVRPGDTLSFPLKLQATNLSFTKATGYTLSLSLNKDILIPIGGTPAGTISQLNRVYTFSGPPPDETLDLGTMRYVAVNASSAVTPLSLQFSLEGGTCPYDAKLTSGNVSVVVCNAGGERLVQIGKAAKLRAVEPNPAHGNTTIAYDLLEDGRTRMELVDASGRTVATLVDGFMRAGSHVAQLDASTLSSGRYLCVLTTPTERLTTEVQVAH